MRLLLILVLFLSVGCRCFVCEPQVYYSPSGKPFPTHWGKPPEIQTKDYRPLPYGYGHGSSTLYGWIINNRENEIQHRFNDLPDTILLLEK